MKLISKSVGARVGLVALLSQSSAALAQITITSTDMFNKAGQYYLAYANNPTNTVSVSSMLGTTGGSQVWDFSDGPQDITYRFDYLTATNGNSGADFAALGATITEQKTDQADPTTQAWLYFDQDPIKGRLDYGFYDPAFSQSQPETVFNSTIQDFPAKIQYGDTWQGTTVFNSVYTDADFGDFNDEVTYTSTDRVDAYGLVILPGMGFLNCLRVHEVVEYDIAIDLGLGDGYQNAGTQYVLNYYWLCPGHGIAVQITSNTPTDGSIPTDDMSVGAAALVRMFQTNHDSNNTTNPPPVINNFKCVLGPGGGLLKWTLSPSLKNYTVEYSTNITSSAAWTPLGTVTNNFLLDPVAGSPGAPVRLYRVVGN